MLSVMRSYMQTCHFILLNNYCLFINGTKLVKISGLFRFTCIVCGIQCISFLPLFDFTLMNVDMNTGIK